MGENGTTSAALPALTAKQREVLALVADNRTSKEIAGRLGISESAVNQRIEIVRARLGGLPRGELARLYRQEYAPPDENSDDSDDIWKKIHLPEMAVAGNEALTEGISSRALVGSQLAQGPELDGSQLSAYFYESEADWLQRENRAMALARGGAILVIIIAGMIVAAGVTQLVGTGLYAG